MKSLSIYIIITAAALFCFTIADAQQKKPAKKVVIIKKTTNKKIAGNIPVKGGVKKPAAVSKKVASLAKSLGDTTKKGGSKKPVPPPVPNNTLSEEVVVTTTYKPVLADAVKIRRNPNLEDTEPFKAPLVYTALDKTLRQDNEIKQLEAIKMPPEQDSVVYNNYAKAGLGSLKTTYGEAYFNNGRDQALQVGGFIKHYALNGNLYKQNYNKEELGVFGKSIGETSSISGRIGYNYQSHDFYGYDLYNRPTILNVDQQHFSTLSGEAEIAKNYKDEENQFIYALKLGGYAFKNAFQAAENSVHVSGYINQTVNQFYAGLAGSADFTSTTDSAYTYGNNIIRANPYIKFQGDNYKIDAGVNLVSEFGFSSRIHLFPSARLEFQIVPNYVRLFVEARGDVNKASLLDYSETNPFLGQNTPIKNSVDQIDLSAGLKGMLAPGLGFKASIFRNSVKDMPLFVSDFNFTKGYNRFTVVYDNGTSRVSGLNAELDYKASDAVDIFGRAEIKNYTLATEAQPWNLPSLKITAGTVLHIGNKVNVNGSLVFRGSTQDRVNGTQVVTLSSFADLSGGVEYKVNNRFSIFAQANNILSNNGQNWLYYPNYGFNIFGGVGYKF